MAYHSALVFGSCYLYMRRSCLRQNMRWDHSREKLGHERSTLVLGGLFVQRACRFYDALRKKAGWIALYNKKGGVFCSVKSPLISLLPLLYFCHYYKFLDNGLHIVFYLFNYTVRAACHAARWFCFSEK